MRLAIFTAVSRDVRQQPSNHLVIVVAVAAAVGMVAVQDVRLNAADEESTASLIQRVIAQTTRSGFSIRAIRELRAGTISGKHQGWMTVETALTSSGDFSWHVLEQGGSERTRDKVLAELLKNEAEAWR